MWTRLVYSLQCQSEFLQEETPYISWISARALSAGDQIAFGAAETGALQVSGLDCLSA